VTCVLTFATLILAWFAPMVSRGISEQSGLVAYLDRWQTNSAVLPLLSASIANVQNLLGLQGIDPGAVTRALIAATLGGLAMWLARDRIYGMHDLVWRASILISALLLLSPAQYPWYAVWLTPFLAFTPFPAMLWLMCLLPLYYLRFALIEANAGHVFETAVVWMIWGPVLLLVAWQLLAAHLDRRAAPANVRT
jgi:hypothetical protein